MSAKHQLPLQRVDPWDKNAVGKRNRSPALHNLQPQSSSQEFTLQMENTSSLSKTTQHQGKKKERENMHKKKIKA